MCATCNHPGCPYDKPIPLRPYREGKIHRFGLDLEPEAFDRVRESLDRINTAEREANPAKETEMNGHAAARKAVMEWIDADPQRDLVGCTPAMIAQIAVDAYLAEVTSITGTQRRMTCP